MNDGVREAPGHPGIQARWTSSSKTGVGTSLSSQSRVWFTLSHGILNEIYYPRIDSACTRDLGLIVTDGRSFFSEEKRDAISRCVNVAPGVAAYRLTNDCVRGRYRIEKEILADPRRDVVLQRTRFLPLQGTLEDYRVYALLAPHLGNRGSGNTAFLGDHKGVPMLLASREGTALALACSAPWRERSVGFVGTSDGWQDLSRNKRLTERWTHARDGNVAMVGEIDLGAAEGEFLLAIGFGRTAAEAGHLAISSLQEGFERAARIYERGWEAWQGKLRPLEKGESETPSLYRTSAMVLRVHEEKQFAGGIIASLSVPWGTAKGDDDLGGYHLVWPRDLVEAAGGLLAAGAQEDARRVLAYLEATQEADGHWPQNMWLDGSPFWTGTQMDETALPILLVDLLRREQALDGERLQGLWPMVRRAAAYIARNGPVTQQDRWEEDPGYSPYTLAAEIAALVVAADLAEGRGEGEVAAYLRETADAWNDSVERWIYATDSDLSRRAGVEGYYVRVAPPESAECGSPIHGFVPVKNRPPGESTAPAEEIVSPDALSLVRFGLRAADDPRILSTVRVIDSLLRVETPAGPAWRRYNGDGYGEGSGGEPFEGTGIGRAWPLLVGERAHYELAAGRVDEARRLRTALRGYTNGAGMLPEQIWDAEDIPEKELFFGKPSGSAMPLVWAHAEYVKLLRSLAAGRVFDTPPQTLRRYVVEKRRSEKAIWRFNHKCRSIARGLDLRIEVLSPARVRWGRGGWAEVRETPTRDTGLGVHVADLPAGGLRPGERVSFTFYWTGPGVWEGTDFEVCVA